jgi:serine/threonine-protein kinase
MALPPQPPAPQRRKRPGWPWLLGATLVACAVLLLLVTTLTPKRVSVPKVVGAKISVAEQRLRNDGFDVSVVRDNSDKPRNTVIAQDPQGGSTADEGSQITLNVSEGPAITAVPDVSGLPRNDAHKVLRAQGFDFEDTPTASDGVKIGRVISQEPSPRSSAQQGTKVNLAISTGPEKVPVPDVVGKTVDEARSALEDVGLRVSVKPKEDDTADPGTVLSQDRARGSELALNSVVTVIVAAQPKQVVVPDVVGRSQNNATKTLSGRGFEVAPEDVAVDAPDQDGVVQKQSPQPGGKIDRGAAVTISVGRFDPTVTTPPPTTTTPPPTTTTTTTTPAPPPPAIP